MAPEQLPEITLVYTYEQPFLHGKSLKTALEECPLSWRNMETWKDFRFLQVEKKGLLMHYFIVEWTAEAVDTMGQYMWLGRPEWLIHPVLPVSHVNQGKHHGYRMCFSFRTSFEKIAEASSKPSQHTWSPGMFIHNYWSAKHSTHYFVLTWPERINSPYE